MIRLKQFMIRLFYTLLVALTLTACAETYHVKGLVSSREGGSTLYLKTFNNNEFVTIDSCSMLHGTFEFEGTIDTVSMAAIFYGDTHILPLILEPEPITININNTDIKVTGTEMNDSLYSFLNRHLRLESGLHEIESAYNQIILNGGTEEDAEQFRYHAYQNFEAQADVLFRTFISQNYDNILGPFVFNMLTRNVAPSQLTPQIEHILVNATDKFKAHPLVKEYYAATLVDADVDAEPTDSLVAPVDTTALLAQ